jgi:hypothetical protein
MQKIIFCAILLLTAGSCHKALSDINDYFPKVKTTGVSVQTDGTVLVQGEIVSEGASAIEYAGFCTGTSQEPTLKDKQGLATTLTGNQFSVVFDADFNPDSVYYFRAFATNSYGYTYGEILSLSHIIHATVTPPCNQAINSGSVGGGQPVKKFDTVSSASAGFQTWNITATSYDGLTISCIFGPNLTTGVYTTVHTTTPQAGQVDVSFYDGFLAGYLNAGSKVYVNRVQTGVFDITICNAGWFYNGGTNPLYMNARFKSPT